MFIIKHTLTSFTESLGIPARILRKEPVKVSLSKTEMILKNILNA